MAPDGPALRALLEGRVDDAEGLLRSALAQNASDSTAHQLLCRVFYAQNQADAAIHECELATTTDSRSSDNFLWLARAYGMKASHAGPLAGFSLARRVHVAFETAVRLSPSNVPALSDLGEYYVDAPSIVGGGDDKARAFAERIMPQFPTPAHRILAMLADSDKDLPTAESEYKLAVSSAKGSEAQAAAWIDLAHFYQVHKRYDEAVAAIRSVLTVERAHGPVLVDAASILTDAGREPALAERCLRDYLAGHSRSDAAPAFKVHLQLARLLSARGLSEEASRETATAQALAPAFRSPRSTQGI
jgi:tetratricopeptide (TPR) repeat protein